MKKEQLIENLENYSSYYQNNIIFNLCLKLIKGTDENDPDFKEVLEDETGEQIIDLYVKNYDEKDFLEFLNKNDFDCLQILKNYPISLWKGFLEKYYIHFWNFWKVKNYLFQTDL